MHPIKQVEVTDRVVMTLMSHALTNEGEEIMGLLLGNVSEDEEGNRISRIWMACPQIRTDRRKDRVECSPEQVRTNGRDCYSVILSTSSDSS